MKITLVIDQSTAPMSRQVIEEAEDTRDKDVMSKELMKRSQMNPGDQLHQVQLVNNMNTCPNILKVMFLIKKIKQQKQVMETTPTSVKRNKLFLTLLELIRIFKMIKSQALPHAHILQ